MRTGWQRWLLWSTRRCRSTYSARATRSVDLGRLLHRHSGARRGGFFGPLRSSGLSFQRCRWWRWREASVRIRPRRHEEGVCGGAGVRVCHGQRRNYRGAPVCGGYKVGRGRRRGIRVVHRRNYTGDRTESTVKRELGRGGKFSAAVGSSRGSKIDSARSIGGANFVARKEEIFHTREKI
jgi:hypothetical protein